MHSEALQWLDACRARLSVCDLGSLNVNGSARDHFHGWDYVGVDCRPGPGVTVVADAREYDADGRQFDVVVSCEMLEHCPDWHLAVVNAYRLTKPGGYFLELLPVLVVLFTARTADRHSRKANIMQISCLKN